MPTSYQGRKPTRMYSEPQYRLPPSFHREIGRIVVSFTYFENAVRRVLWALLGADERIGRVAIRDPRVTDTLEMVIDVALLKGITVDEPEIKKISTGAEEVQKCRDLVTHGNWTHEKGDWFVQMISGVYPKNAMSEHRKRRIAPEGLGVDLDGLRKVTETAEVLIEAIKSVWDDIQPQLPPSPSKRP